MSISPAWYPAVDGVLAQVATAESLASSGQYALAAANALGAVGIAQQIKEANKSTMPDDLQRQIDEAVDGAVRASRVVATPGTGQAEVQRTAIISVAAARSAANVLAVESGKSTQMSAGMSNGLKTTLLLGAGALVLGLGAYAIYSSTHRQAARNPVEVHPFRVGSAPFVAIKSDRPGSKWYVFVANRDGDASGDVFAWGHTRAQALKAAKARAHANASRALGATSIRNPVRGPR